MEERLAPDFDEVAVEHYLSKTTGEAAAHKHVAGCGRPL